MNRPEWLPLMSSSNNDLDEAVITKHKEKTEEKVEEPPLYKVIIHNDDFTPMPFVVFVLKEVFQYSDISAVAMMLKVHVRGTGVVGVYTFEIAETKVQKATNLAQDQGYPLLFSIEEDRS